MLNIRSKRAAMRSTARKPYRLKIELLERLSRETGLSEGQVLRKLFDEVRQMRGFLA